MEKLNISTGRKSYQINDTDTIEFNPTDSSFVEKLFDVFDSLDKKQDEYREKLAAAAGKAVFDVARQCDAEMREKINNLFDKDICGSLFGEMNVYAMADGLPVWCNLLLAVMDEIDDSFVKERQMTDERVRKYTAKYHK